MHYKSCILIYTMLTWWCVDIHYLQRAAMLRALLVADFVLAESVDLANKYLIFFSIPYQLPMLLHYLGEFSSSNLLQIRKNANKLH